MQIRKHEMRFGMIPLHILYKKIFIIIFHWHKAIVLALLVTFCFHKVSLSENLVLNGLPIWKVSSSFEDTNRVILTESEQNEFRLLITGNNGKYYWASRGNRELTLKISGAIYIFIDPMGGGYIEILDTDIVPEFSKTGNRRFVYKEHLRNFLTNITYWGFANEFSP